MKWYKSAIIWATGEIDKIEQKANIKCTCSCGCAACCKQAIAVTSTEVVIIRKFFETMDASKKKFIYHRACEVYNILKQKGLTEALNQCFLRTTQDFKDEPIETDTVRRVKSPDK